MNLQRRFALEHTALLKQKEKTIKDTEDDEEIDQEDEDIDMDVDAPSGRQGGRIAAGQDFWGQVDKFFSAMLVKYGRDLTGAGWKV